MATCVVLPAGMLNSFSSQAGVSVLEDSTSGITISEQSAAVDGAGVQLTDAGSGLQITESGSEADGAQQLEISSGAGITLHDDSPEQGLTISEAGAAGIDIVAAAGVNINSSGTGEVTLGQTGDELALYGSTPVAQPAAIDQVPTGVGATPAANAAAINAILDAIGAGAGGIGITE